VCLHLEFIHAQAMQEVQHSLNLLQARHLITLQDRAHVRWQQQPLSGEGAETKLGSRHALVAVVLLLGWFRMLTRQHAAGTCMKMLYPARSSCTISERHSLPPFGTHTGALKCSAQRTDVSWRLPQLTA
jgi:hypothetical protein